MSDFKNQSPWGSPPGGGNGGFRRGPTPPDIDEVIKKIQNTINRFTGGGKGGSCGVRRLGTVMELHAAGEAHYGLGEIGPRVDAAHDDASVPTSVRHALVVDAVVNGHYGSIGTVVGT